MLVKGDKGHIGGRGGALRAKKGQAALFKGDGALVQHADADFRAGQILEDRDGDAVFDLDTADGVDEVNEFRGVAVGEVEPEDARAGVNELGKFFLGAAGRTQGGDNFRFHLVNTAWLMGFVK